MKFIGRYLWNVLKSVAAVFFTFGLVLWKRILMLFYHILSAPVFFVSGVIEGIKILFSTPSRWFKWFLDSLLSILKWAGRAVTKTMDVALIPEILDLLFQIVKPNQRMLTDTELTEAQKVFGNSIRWWYVRIDEFSLFAKFGAWWAGTPDMGVTTFHTINFTNKINSAPGNEDMIWLIHELAHIRQMETAGSQYLAEAWIAQNTTGYGYGGQAKLNGKKLADFNREQQAEIAADYYARVLYGESNGSSYEPLIDEMKSPVKLFA